MDGKESLPTEKSSKATYQEILNIQITTKHQLLFFNLVYPKSQSKAMPGLKLLSSPPKEMRSQEINT